MRTKLSTCARKVRYATVEAALAACRDAGVVLRPYGCDRCGRFHLTSRIKGKWVGGSNRHPGPVPGSTEHRADRPRLKR